MLRFWSIVLIKELNSDLNKQSNFKCYSITIWSVHSSNIVRYCFRKDNVRRQSMDPWFWSKQGIEIRNRVNINNWSIPTIICRWIMFKKKTQSQSLYTSSKKRLVIGYHMYFCSNICTVTACTLQLYCSIQVEILQQTKYGFQISKKIEPNVLNQKQMIPPTNILYSVLYWHSLQIYSFFYF